jgi:hypothetical protein
MDCKREMMFQPATRRCAAEIIWRFDKEQPSHRSSTNPLDDYNHRAHVTRQTSSKTKMENSKSPCLLLQAEKVLPQPAHPHLIACCPTMDLVAVVNQDEQLNVYRFGGQRALGLQRRSPTSTVVSLCWKFNGKSLYAL